MKVNKTNLAGVILENNNGQFALNLRDDNPNIADPGMWGLFGGHIEEGESPLVAAIREINEEISIKLRPSKMTYLGEFATTDKVFHVYHYLIEDEAKHAVLHEGQDWRWCTREEIKLGKIGIRNVIPYQIQFFVRFWNNKLSVK